VNLGAALLAALGVLAALLAWMLPNPSRRTRLVLGSTCVILLVIAVLLTIRPNLPGGSSGASGSGTVGAAGHDWPVLPTVWDEAPVDSVEGGPIVAGERVVVTTKHRRIQAFNASNGTSAWPPYATRSEDVNIAAADDRIVFLDQDSVNALSMKTGKLIWSAHSGEPLYGAALGARRDLVLIKNGSGLSTLNTATGKVRWTWESGHNLGKIVASNDTVWVADDVGHVYAVDLRTGKLRWTYSIPHDDPVESAIAVVGNAVLFPAGPGGTVYAITELRGSW
jgi:hypothetical protein